MCVYVSLKRCVLRDAFKICLLSFRPFPTLVSCLHDFANFSIHRLADMYTCISLPGPSEDPLSDFRVMVSIENCNRHCSISLPFVNSLFELRAVSLVDLCLYLTVMLLCEYVKFNQER